MLLNATGGCNQWERLNRGTCLANRLRSNSQRQTTEHKEDFTGKDVLSFLGDFGIGDSMEYSEAIESGTTRISDLQELKREKGCKVSAGDAETVTDEP